MKQENIALHADIPGTSSKIMIPVIIQHGNGFLLRKQVSYQFDMSYLTDIRKQKYAPLSSS